MGPYRLLLAGLAGNLDVSTTLDDSAGHYH